MKYEVWDTVYFYKSWIYKAVVLFAYEFIHKDIYSCKKWKDNHQVYLLEKTTLWDRFNRFELMSEQQLFSSKAECINYIDKTK